MSQNSRKSVGSHPLLKGQLGIKSFFSKSQTGSRSLQQTEGPSEGNGHKNEGALKENVEVVCNAGGMSAVSAVSTGVTATQEAPKKTVESIVGKVVNTVFKKKAKVNSRPDSKPNTKPNSNSKPKPKPKPNARPRRASTGKKKLIVESDSEDGGEKSGSEYGMSEDESADGSSDEEMSDLVAEVESEDGEMEEESESEDEALEAKLKKVQAAKRKAPTVQKQTPSISRVSKPTDTSHSTPASNAGTPTANLGTPNTRASDFDTRASERFPFLHPDKLMDKKRRRPSDPEYDPSTLYIPPSWFDSKPKPTPAQAQWWQFKAENFDSVLLFKMGKFYELFEMDAHTGVETLGLSYMKGDQPHAGFPEAAYAEKVERLVRAGKRAVVIEQVETPDMLAERNELRKKKGLKRDPVVAREKVAVVTKATITDGEMMKGAGGEIAYLASVADRIVEVGDAQRAIVGIVVVDVAAARVIAGQFEDDELRSHLRAVLTALKPSEIVMPKDGALSAASRKVIKGILQGPLVDERPVGEGDDAFYSVETFWRVLKTGGGDAAGGYFGGGGTNAEMPMLLQRLKEDSEGGVQKFGVLSLALGGLLANLRRGMVDRWVFCASKWSTIEEVLGQLGRTGQASQGSQSFVENPVGSMVESSVPQTSMSSGRTLTLGGYSTKTMALDGAALENLEILENAEGGAIGSLLGALDHCVTPFGKRRLREWLCKPLFVIDEIRARQDAVRDLMDGAEESAGEARSLLAGLTDIERSIVRICASGIGIGSLRDSRAILYEDVSKKKIKAVYSTLLDIRKTIKAVKAFAGVVKSAYLESLVGSGSFPDVETPLNRLMDIVDWPDAERTGRIEPQEGMDEGYDAAAVQVRQAQVDLDRYLDEVRSEVSTGGKLIKLISLQKDPYVLEVPDHIKVPSGWSSLQGKKGYKRYMTDELKRLTEAMAKAKEEKEVAQTKILSNIMAKFAEHRGVWLEAVDRIASLDALMSLAKAGACGDGPMCCPEFVDADDGANGGGGKPIFHATQLRHPAGIPGGKGGFVPNDVHLGGNAAPFMLLTGPNMGGKSTVMRQVCLATVAAQVGAWVPADSLKLSPADALFVRMGAKDNLILGQSTFFIELSETAAALHRATKHSLVALDELGRGTATIDGAAIAGAVLEFLADSVGCRGVFATHYHKLAGAYDDDGDGSRSTTSSVQTMHMGCTVRTTEDAVDDIIFLYKLARGACPKSFGSNVAKLAGLPLDVVTRAATISARLEGGSEIHGLARAVSRALADGAVGGVGVGTLESLQRKVVNA